MNKPRKRATKEEVIMRLEEQNKKYAEKIEQNNQRIAELRKPTIKMKDLAIKMRENGMSIEDVINMIDSKSK